MASRTDRDTLLARLNQLRQQRLDADPADHDRLTAEIDTLLDQLAETRT